MDAATLRQLIDAEIAAVSAAAEFNWHGCQPTERLEEPVRIVCTDADGVSRSAYWLVFQEYADSPVGYWIVYDEEDASFGLAIAGSNTPCCIGLYGTFLDTFRSM